MQIQLWINTLLILYFLWWNSCVRSYKDLTDNKTLLGASFRPFPIQKLLVLVQEHVCFPVVPVKFPPSFTLLPVLKTWTKNPGTIQLRAVEAHCAFEKLQSGTEQVGDLVFQPCRALNARMKWDGNLVWTIVQQRSPNFQQVVAANCPVNPVGIAHNFK